MKIGLLSDTHGYIDPQLFEFFASVDEIWHAGDIGNIDLKKIFKQPIRAVYGNIDDQNIRQEYPLHNRFKLLNKDIWITHIGGYPPRYNPRIREILSVKPPDLFICGHSHILKVIYDQKHNLLHINPGAAGKHGFHKVQTAIRFEISEKGFSELEILEMKWR